MGSNTVLPSDGPNNSRKQTVSYTPELLSKNNLIQLVLVAAVAAAFSFLGAFLALQTVTLTNQNEVTTTRSDRPPRGSDQGARSDGKGQVGTTGMWEPGTGSTISASRAGRGFTPATLLSSTRRRMRQVKGRALTVDVATVDYATATDLLSAAQETGDYTGSISVEVSSGTAITSGRMYNYNEGSSSSALSGHVTDGTNNYLVTCDASLDICTASVDAATVLGTSDRRLNIVRLDITDADAELLNDRRRLHWHIDRFHAGKNLSSSYSTEAHSIFIHDKSCLVYHCFEGDTDCPNPAPDFACLEWEDPATAGDNTEGRWRRRTCKKPLCEWVNDPHDTITQLKVEGGFNAVNAHLHLGHHHRLQIIFCESDDDCTDSKYYSYCADGECQ